MNVLIVEDEEQAFLRISRILRSLDNKVFIHGPLESITETVKWIKENPIPDLILMDIHLADGLSFEIFERTQVEAPIVFTTAYDQYAIKAFKVNSIDYLLKPVEADELKNALVKYKNQILKQPEEYHELLSDYKNKYKQRFLSRVGDKLMAIPTEEVAFVYSEDKATFLRTQSGRSHIIDFTMEQVENLLDPNDFFRLNRKYIARAQSLDKIIAYSNSRLKVKLLHWDDEDIVLSRERTRDFKVWLDT